MAFCSNKLPVNNLNKKVLKSHMFWGIKAFYNRKKQITEGYVIKNLIFAPHIVKSHGRKR
jgi:hypothetical protein